MRSMPAQEVTRCYKINCSILIKDSLLNIENLKNYLEARIKVRGRTGNLDGNVDLVCMEDLIVVKPKVKVRLPKKYLKYLGNKFLYKEELKDWVRILSTGKGSYKLVYYRAVSNKDE